MFIVCALVNAGQFVEYSHQSMIERWPLSVIKPLVSPAQMVSRAPLIVPPTDTSCTFIVVKPDATGGHSPFCTTAR